MCVNWLVVLLAAAEMCGCHRPSCQNLAEHRDDMIVATACARAFEESGNPADGIVAAQIYGKLHRDDQALELASRLLGGSRGSEARRVMAPIYLERHQFDAARPLLEEALRLDQDRGDHAGAYADAAPLVRAYWIQNDFRAALKLANLACAEAAASSDSKLHADSLIDLGSVFQAAGDSARALDAYARATTELPPGDQAGRARVLLSRAALLDQQRQYALARPLLEEARTLAVGLGKFSLLLAAEVNLADIALGQRDLDAAARHLDAAQAAWQASGTKKPSQGILVNRAILARYRGDFGGAIRALDVAAASEPPPDTAWIIAHERGQIAAARHDLETAERSYLTAIGIVEEMWRTSSPEDLKAPFFEDRWRPYQSLFALRVERNTPAAAFETMISAQGRMFLAETIAASAGDGWTIERRDHLRSLAPLVATSPIARAFGPAETLAALGDRYALNYFAGGGRMRLLVIDRGKVRLASVNIDVDDLEKLVDDFLSRPDDRAAAEVLGNALLPPDALASAPNRFHVIPDGPLLRVPFAALIAGGARLIEHHEIVYAPSATGLAGLSAVAAIPTTAAVLLSDARNNLHHGAEETASVVAATKAAPLTGGDATIAALRSAQHASLLHVVGHSGVGIDGGYLVLADGQVTAAEILGWHLRPHLVVLPTCASAAANRRDMWGSLAMAFLAAGSIDVVATLFSIEDRTAAEFTETFYRHDGARDSVAATAAAQRELATHHPVSAWSAFMVVGL
jgi:tetratricopeptide (TPR) repeat protein